MDRWQLKDALGKPGEGVHFHVCGIAIMDVLATLVVGCLLGWLCSIYNDYFSLWMLCAWCTMVLLVLGEVLHLVLGVDTTVAKWLKEKP